MFNQKIIGMAPPERLGFIRVITVAAALMYVLWENFPSIAEVPYSWYKPQGFMMFFPERLIWHLHWNVERLMAFKLLTVFFLSLALFGIFTQISLFIATCFYFYFIGVVRGYAWFFHTGLIPLYLMFFMIWLPSGDGVSLDKRFFFKKNNYFLDQRPSPSVGWAVFLLRAIVAACYFQAGFAKLRNMGLPWIAPWNLKHFFIQDSLDIMHFNFDLGLRVMYFPDWFFVILAVAAIASELLYPVMLFSWQIRLVYPLIGMMLHGMIMLFHNIFFPDLILIQLVFYDWDRVFTVPQLPPHDRRKRSLLAALLGR